MSQVQVLVGQEAHGYALYRARNYDDLVRDRVGGIAQRGLDIVVRQSRVRVEDVGFRRPESPAAGRRGLRL